MAPGFWYPALSNILKERDLEWVIPISFAIGPLVSIFSPLFFGAMADYRYAAQKLMGTLSLLGAVFLGLAFASLHWNWGGWYYIIFQTLNALISAPMWAILSTVALTNLSNAEKSFPLYRVWGTVGWIVANVIVSWLAWDSSPMAGIVAAVVRVIVGFACFLMPHTPPPKLGQLEESAAMGSAYRWRRYLGLDALVLFKERRMRVFLLTGTLVSIPLAAFFMYTPLLLTSMGDKHPVASQSLGQITEIFAMLALSAFMLGGGKADERSMRRTRTLLTLGLICALLRYGFFSWSAWTDTISLAWIGIAMHGPCYTFFFVTAQIFINQRVDAGMRAQAQALFSTLIGGVGGSIGSLLCGAYYYSTKGLVHGWVFFWAGLTLAVLGCTMYFMLARRRE